jgi:hypothetical protein
MHVWFSEAIQKVIRAFRKNQAELLGLSSFCRSAPVAKIKSQQNLCFMNKISDGIRIWAKEWANSVVLSIKRTGFLSSLFFSVTAHFSIYAYSQIQVTIINDLYEKSMMVFTVIPAQAGIQKDKPF